MRRSGRTPWDNEAKTGHPIGMAHLADGLFQAQGVLHAVDDVDADVPGGVRGLGAQVGGDDEVVALKQGGVEASAYMSQLLKNKE